jgi:hypothetical protein
MLLFRNLGSVRLPAESSDMMLHTNFGPRRAAVRSRGHIEKLKQVGERIENDDSSQPLREKRRLFERIERHP